MYHLLLLTETIIDKYILWVNGSEQFEPTQEP